MIFVVTGVSKTRLFARTGAGLVVLFAVLALLACQPSIEVLQPQTPLPVATVAPAAHSIALIGVDFDPPLDYFRLMPNSGLTLLVAVENRGFMAAPYVEVRGRLLDPTEANVQAIILDEVIVVRDLAPGELRVVRFSEVRDLPIRARYELVVQVGHVPGDAVTEDNIRSYDILVRQSDQ